MKTSFQNHLVHSNKLDALGFKHFIFLPGMLFQSRNKWWDDGGRREKPHEGLDLCFFESESGHYYRLDESTKIPMILDGRIVKIIDDFLGTSIFAAHEIFNVQGKQLLTLFGHTEPNQDLTVGNNLKEGENLGRIAKTGDEKEKIIPHLHISMAWVPKKLPLDDLTWNRLNVTPEIKLIDPLTVMDCRYLVLEKTSYKDLLQNSLECRAALKEM